MNYWDSDSVWEGDHDDTSSLSKTLACLEFDDSKLSEETRNRLRSVYYAADGMHYDDESYLASASSNALEWRGLKLLIKNIIDLEDFVRESARAPVLDLNDDEVATGQVGCTGMVALGYVEKVSDIFLKWKLVAWFGELHHFRCSVKSVLTLKMTQHHVLFGQDVMASWHCCPRLSQENHCPRKAIQVHQS